MSALTSIRGVAGAAGPCARAWPAPACATLFAADPARFAQLSLRFEDVLLDYSKHLVDAETMRLLFDLARHADVENWRAMMFEGAKINHTEHRAVLHVALRNRGSRPILVDGRDVMPDVNGVLARMAAFVESVRSGAWRGHSGQRITDIVHIGIGGSDLGPRRWCGTRCGPPRR